MQATPSVLISVDLLDDPPSNPNRMSDAVYKLLVEAMRKVGFVQPVLVMPVGGRIQIIDGVHRVRAARELGLKEVTAIVITPQQAQERAIQVGMNRMRGDLDLGAVSETVDYLRGEGWSLDDLTLTGFEREELSAMLASVNALGDDVLAGSNAALPDNTEAAPKPFVIELLFATRAELTKAKKGLRKAAGGGKHVDLAQGLLRLIDGS
jgi:ParB-like chromosome segregation protein Spo0J